MKQYWPCAVAVKKSAAENHSTEKAFVAFTYGCCSTLEEAKKCIDKWAEIYAIMTAWVDECDDSGNITVVYHECNMDAVGHIYPHIELCKSKQK